MLNRRLAAQVLQRYPEQKRVPGLEVAGIVIIASPRHAQFEAVILIGDSEPVSYRLITVGTGIGVLMRVGKIDYRRAEN
jgi:hypothetical protein